MGWRDAQKWEKEWWDNCINTYGEETKQLLYAEKMGLSTTPDAKTPYRFDLGGISVLDVGGGCTSLLLKCVNVDGEVLDPLMESYPQWVLERYEAAGLSYGSLKGEEINYRKEFDEVWIYNVLEHTEDPQKVVENAKKAGNLIRLFEWIDTVPSEGHLHAFSKQQLDGWLGGDGQTEMIARGRAKGRGYYGIFPC